MKKYVVRYAFATNLIEHLSGAEPNLPIADCSKLPLGDQIADHVLAQKIKTIDAPFSVDSENDAVLLHVEQTESGLQLFYIDEITAVKAVQSELKSGIMHLGINPDGTATGRAFLALPYCGETYGHILGFVKAGGQKVAPKKAPKRAPDPDPDKPAKPCKPAKKDDNPFDDDAPNDVMPRGRCFHP